MAYYQCDYGSRYTNTGCDPLEVRLSSLESKISDLTNLVKEMTCRKAPSVGMFGTNIEYTHPIDSIPTFHYNTEPAYNDGVFPYSCQQAFDSYSSTYYSGWQNHPNPNEYECEWQEQPVFSYEQTPPTTNHTTENSGMSLEEMVQLTALTTTFCSFQQETRAQIQDLTKQINEFISFQHRWEAKEKETRLVDELKLQAFIDEEDAIKQKSVVMPPSYLEPIVDKIKVEEELVDTRGTFTKLEEPMVDGIKVTPGDDAFADLQRELSPKSKDIALEIRMDFKAPQHVEKKHVWGIDLLDTG